jgi:hypothetical protein
LLSPKILIGLYVVYYPDILNLAPHSGSGASWISKLKESCPIVVEK